MASPHSLLGLPREIRDLIYVTLFRSLVFDGNNPQYYGKDCRSDPRLAILRVCWQIDAEASPLVLQHVNIYCISASDMLRVLVSMSSEQIRQLKYLRVDYSITAFRLPCSESARGDTRVNHKDRGFHVGALLGLFPGLQLDLLDLADRMSMGYSGFEHYHGPDLVDSLLKADGFKEVRARIRASDRAFSNEYLEDSQGSWSQERRSGRITAWGKAIQARFRGRPGWGVELYIDEPDCPSEFWEEYRKAGFTLLNGLEARDIARTFNDDGAEVLYWNFRACRGNGHCMVAEEDDRVLEYTVMPTTTVDPETLNAVSDELRHLFRDGNWARIEQAEKAASMNIDGPYDESWFW